MADIPNSDELKKINEAAVETVEQFQQLSAAIKGIYKDLNAATGESYRFNDASKQSVNLAKTLSGYTQEDLANQRKRTRFERDTNKVKSDLAALEAQIEQSSKRQNTLKGKAAVANQKLVRSLADQRDLIKDALEDAEEMVKVQGELNKRTKFFGDLSDFIAEIPLVNKLLPEFKKAFEAAQTSVAKGGSAWAGGIKEFTSGIGKLVSAFAVGTLVKGFGKVDKEIVGLQRSLNLSKDQARDLFNQFNDTPYFTTTQLIKAQDDLNKSLGTAAGLRNVDAETLATVTERMGLSSQSANTLFTAAAATGKEFKEFSADLIGAVKYQNVLSGRSVDYKAVMQDVAEAGAATRLSLQQFPGGIVKAAYEARKLGLNLSQLEKTAGSLLDFESSIEAELEAELLSGREYNLERARALALTNDLTGLNEELAAQNITQAQFANANRLDQEAMAKMIGMSRDEMAQMFEKQAAIERVSKEDLDTKAKMRQLLGEGLSIAEATTALGIDEIKYRKEQMTMEEARAKLQDRMLNVAEDFLDIYEGFKSILQGIIPVAEKLMYVLLGIAAIRFGRNIGNLGKNLSNISKTASTTAASTTAASSAASAAGGGAAKAASAGASSAASTAASSTASAGGGIGGFFKNTFAKGKDLLAQGKNAIGNFSLKGLLANAKGVLKGLGPKILKLGGISAILEGLFIKGDIDAIVSSAASKEEAYQSIGTRVWGGLGGVAGGALLGALGSALGPLGTIGGGILGDYLGRMLAESLSESIGSEGMGKFMLDNVFSGSKQMNPELGLATGGIVTQPTRALVGEAGAEAVVPLREFYAKFDELISTVKQGGNVYMDSMQVGHSTTIGTSRLG